MKSKFFMNLQYATRQECDLHFRECTIPAARRAISCKYYLLVWNNAGSVGTCDDVWNESNNDSRLLIPHLLPYHRIRILANRDRGHSHCRRRCCRNDDVRDITRSRGVNSNNTLARTIRGKALIRILGHASSWITFVQCPMGWRL